MAKTQSGEINSDISFGVIIGAVIGVSVGAMLSSITLGLITWIAVFSCISFASVMSRKQS